MSGTIITPVANALVAKAAALTYTPAPFTYLWGRDNIDRVPAILVKPPSGDRTPPDTAESQLYADDWTMRFGVMFLTDTAEAALKQQHLIDLLELYVVAVDADETLGGTVLSARVARWEEPVVLDREKGRPLLMLASTVEVLKLV